MGPRADFRPTDIARQNADAVIAVGMWLTSQLLRFAVCCAVLESIVATRIHVVVTPAYSFRHVGNGFAIVSFRDLIVALVLTFIGVTIEVLVVRRDVFFRQEPTVVGKLIAKARRLFFGDRQADALVLQPSRERVERQGDAAGNGEVLRQLRRALTSLPEAPPSRLALDSDPWGPFAQSGHRAEVCTVA